MPGKLTPGRLRKRANTIRTVYDGAIADLTRLQKEYDHTVRELIRKLEQKKIEHIRTSLLP